MKHTPVRILHVIGIINYNYESPVMHRKRWTYLRSAGKGWFNGTQANGVYCNTNLQQGSLSDEML